MNSLLRGAILSACALFFFTPQAYSQVTANMSPELKIEEAIRKIEEDDLEAARKDVYELGRIPAAARSDKAKLLNGLLLLKSNNAIDAQGYLLDYNKTPEGKTDYRGHAALGRMYQESQMYSVAISYLQTAKKVAPAGMVNNKNVKAEIILDLALCYHGMRKSKQALEEAKDAERLAGTDPKIQLRLSEVALEAEDFDTSMKAADTAISLFKNRINTEPLNKSNYEQLVAAWRFKMRVGIKQADAQASDPRPTYEVAVATREAGEMQRLLGIFESREVALQALQKEQKDSTLTTSVKIFVARTEIDLRAFQEADERVAEVLRADPNNREAQELRRILNNAPSPSSAGK